MYTHQRRAWERRLVRVAALSVALLAITAAAAAAKSTVGLAVGPVTVGPYQVTVFAAGCGKGASATIDYTRGSVSDFEQYSYTGPVRCSASARRGHLSLSWGRLGSLSLTSTRLGGRQRGRLPEGCRGQGAVSRTTTWRGRLHLSLARGLGRLSRRALPGALTVGGRIHCRPPRAAKAITLTAAFGNHLFLDATVPAHGPRGFFLTDTFTPATGIMGAVVLNQTGSGRRSHVTVTRTGGRISAPDPFARGALRFRDLPVCTGASPAAHNVTLSGSITLNTVVLGRVTLSPAAATFAVVAAGNAFPANCNGYGSVPLTPQVSNVCSQNGICSVSAGTNNDTFYDTSNPGTQKIVSETIQFGDGTSGTFTNGQATHTYTTPGTYTATVTITTSNGQVQTATTPVYITS